MNVNTCEYVSTAELGRLANVSPRRIKRARTLGKLTPDFRIGHVDCFRRDRLPALLNVLGVHTFK